MKALDLTGEAYHHTAGDVGSLKELVSVLPLDPIIINIGFCFGTSVLAMAEARPDAYIFAIDHVYCEQGVENLKAAGVWQEGRIFHIVRRSQGMVWPFIVDMVFVDGGHGLADVRGDIETWREHIASGGIMAFHDYGTPSLPSVKAVVDEMMAGYDVALYRETIKAFRVYHNEERIVTDEKWLNYATPYIAGPQSHRADVALAGLSGGKMTPHWDVLRDVLQMVLDEETDYPLSLLDAGCGSAYLSEVIEYFLPSSFEYTGVDYNMGAIALAKERYPTLRVLLGDICDLHMFSPNEFDVVLCCGTLAYLRDWQLGLSELARVSKRWIFLHRVETCTDSETHSRIEKAHGYDVHYRILNEAGLLTEIGTLGFELAHRTPALLGDSWAFLFKRV